MCSAAVHPAWPLSLRVIVRVAPMAVVVAAALLSPMTVRVVRGASMAPALLPGDVCVIREGDRAAMRGDVVLFRKEGWPGGVLHRVLEVASDGTVRTAGDANPVPDLDAVAPEDVLGRCVLVVPTGRAAYFLGSLGGGRLRGQLHSQRR